MTGCPDEGSFRARVASRLGYEPFRSDSTMHVVVQASRSDGGNQGRLEWKDTAGKVQGEQLFSRRSSGCAQLMNEMGFALAVQIELLGAQEAASAPPSSPVETSSGGPASGTPPISPGVPVAPPPSPSTPSSSSEVAGRAPGPWSLRVGGGAAADLGLAPTATASAHLFAELAYAHVLLVVRGGASVPTTDRQPDGSGFHEYAVNGDLAICGSLDRFAVCGVGALGWIGVRGFGVDQPASPHGLVVRAGARMMVSQRLGARLTASIVADGLVLVSPWNVDLSGVSVWTVPRFGGVLGLDLGVHFP